MHEYVMVVEQSLIESCGDLSSGITLDVAPYIQAIFHEGNCMFRLRSEIEEDSKYKQIMPYILVDSGGGLYSYTRSDKDDDSRLQGYKSLGFGDHVFYEDALVPGLNFDAVNSIKAYNNSITRCVQEGIKINSDVITITGHSSFRETQLMLKSLAIICDSTDSVSAAHLSIVHLLRLAIPRVRSVPGSKIDNGFDSVTDLNSVSGDMEVGSKLALSRIVNIDTEERK